NITEAVQNAHLQVEGIVASPLATGFACLSEEERDLGVALVELGGEVTNVSVHAAGMLVGLASIPRGSADITDAIASAFSIKRFQAERLKCVNGSAIASPHDHREMVAVAGPDEEASASIARGADASGRIRRSELIAVITGELDCLMREIGRALEAMGFANGKPGARQVVLTGGGAELAGIADYAQSALGMPVRIGKPPSLRGLPEAHAIPGFATLAGLVLYAAQDPVDIRSLAPRHMQATRWTGLSAVRQVVKALRHYF
ncbi:MAG: rod shape-determining protein, partial [Alteraurantiacibacter sp.]|nr:rod shape-determining protein [Alteraurantiacibacter sp.]